MRLYVIVFVFYVLKCSKKSNLDRYLHRFLFSEGIFAPISSMEVWVLHILVVLGDNTGFIEQYGHLFFLSFLWNYVGAPHLNISHYWKSRGICAHFNCYYIILFFHV